MADSCFGSILVIFTIVISSCMTNFDMSIDFTAAAAENSHLNTLSTLTNQVAALQERNISSNQSNDDIKAIKNSLSEQVQILKNMTQGFAKTSTQNSFAALGVFLLGMTLLLYGL